MEKYLAGKLIPVFNLGLPGAVLILIVSLFLAGDQPQEGMLHRQLTTLSEIRNIPAREQDPAAMDGTTRTLKVLVPGGGSVAISRRERDLLREYAEGEGLDISWIPVAGSDLAGRLARGEGDIVAGYNEKSAGGDLLTSLPWAVAREVVVSRAGGRAAARLEDLTVRQVAVKPGSPVWDVLVELRDNHPTMQILEIPADTDIGTILQRVRSGRYDLAVMSSLDLPPDIGFHYNLEVIMSLTEDNFLSWGVDPASAGLHTSLNKFLNRKHLALEVDRSYREDFPSIKRRKLLRVITYQSAVNYFYDSGGFKGFEYDLMKRFAERHGMRLDVVLADTQEQMYELLGEGKGDVIAASMPEGALDGRAEVRATTPYNYAAPTLVGREGETLLDLRDLGGRTIEVAPESPYLRVLQRLAGRGGFSLLVADTDMNTEAVLFGVARGQHDLTVIGSHEINAEFSRQLNLKAHLSLSEPEPLVWIVRESNTLLQGALNEFIEKEYRRGFYNVVYTRYIERPAPRRADTSLFARLDNLSPYDDIVHKYADQYGFDWRLIIAQMYQESRFNPRAISDAGAEGLMQLMPRTAKMIGVTELKDPSRNIYGGIRYMDYLRSMFEDDLSVEDRIWFTLASYNAGYGRIRIARELAAQMNLDRNKWFNNVELAMLNLARPYMKNGETVRNCRCGQTVAYVREIRTLYNNYLGLTQSVKAAARIVPVEAPGRNGS